MTSDLEQVLRKRDYIGPIDIMAECHAEKAFNEFKEKITDKKVGSSSKKRMTIMGGN